MLREDSAPATLSEASREPISAPAFSTMSVCSVLPAIGILFMFLPDIRNEVRP